MGSLDPLARKVGRLLHLKLSQVDAGAEMEDAMAAETKRRLFVRRSPHAGNKGKGEP